MISLVVLTITSIIYNYLVVIYFLYKISFILSIEIIFLICVPILSITFNFISISALFVFFPMYRDWLETAFSPSVLFPWQI